jgi:hypothetical protein
MQKQTKIIVKIMAMRDLMGKNGESHCPSWYNGEGGERLPICQAMKLSAFRYQQRTSERMQAS